MKLEQSQLDYLYKRGKNYDKKYRIFELLLNKIPQELNLVVELFGGVGIESYYLQKNKKIVEHISIDKDIDCNKLSKQLLPNVTCLNFDSFEYENNKHIDLLVCDSSAFNKNVFDDIANLVNKFDFDYLILTNTGVFNVKLNKNMTYDKYWSELIEQLSERGLYTSDVIYTVDFGMMLVRKQKQNNVSIEKLSNDNLSTMWRSYVAKLG